MPCTIARMQGYSLIALVHCFGAIFIERFVLITPDWNAWSNCKSLITSTCLQVFSFERPTASQKSLLHSHQSLFSFCKNFIVFLNSTKIACSRCKASFKLALAGRYELFAASTRSLVVDCQFSSIKSWISFLWTSPIDAILGSVYPELLLTLISKWSKAWQHSEDSIEFWMKNSS